MTKEERVIYLANVALISAKDGALSPFEARAVEGVRQELGAGKGDLEAALKRVAQTGHVIKPVGRLSERIRNLEDMVFVALSDRELSKAEKPEVLAFAKKIGVTQVQLTQILNEARERIESQLRDKRVPCPGCGKEVPPGSKFCPFCGAPCQ